MNDLMKILKIYHLPLWISAIIALFISCSDPLTPVPPVWDVEANVPLISQSYLMSDLLEKNKSIEISQNENGILILHKNFSIKSIKVGDSLRLKESTYRFSKSLGMLKYDIPEAVSKNKRDVPNQRGGRYGPGGHCDLPNAASGNG